jgi:alkylation response protein AidB-like acyl-CoA dehydrogenase
MAAPTISFAVSEEEQLLRDTARKFLADRCDVEAVRAHMASDTGFDADLWAEVAGMGWQAMAVPERFGGAGYGWHEVGALMEEMGRALFCAPFLSSAVLATAALLASGDEAAQSALLPSLAAGEVRATLAHRTDTSDVTLGPDGTLSGTARFVLDGATADVLLVPARDGDGLTLVRVAGDAAGVVRTALPTLDLTRRQADVTFDGAAAEVVGTAGAGEAVVDRAATVGAVMLSRENVGGATFVLEQATQYAKDRKQFGRAIGSYQAVKHRLAEMLKDLEAARSVALHASATLGRGDDDELAVAAPMAYSYTGGVYEDLTGHNIQIHGGIGFTWEHSAHLYFKRAKTSTLLFGSAGAWRARLADVLGL